jgi:hypothetical protein
VAVGRWQIREGSVAAEEGLDLARPQSTLSTDKEGGVQIGMGVEILTQQRNEAPEDRFLARNPVL